MKQDVGFNDLGQNQFASIHAINTQTGSEDWSTKVNWDVQSTRKYEPNGSICDENVRINMPIEIEMLRKIPYVSALSTYDLAQVAMFTVERHFNRSDLILIAGETEGSLCYVCSGLVKVFKTSPEGKEQVLRLIGVGNTFNDVPALDAGPNPASVAAVELAKYT